MINELTFSDYRQYSRLCEATYAGNIGIMELIKFHKTATPEHVKQLKQLISTKKNSEAWNLVQSLTNTKLDPSVAT